MVLVRETCEYHSRGEEYMVLFRRDLWVPQQTGGGRCLLVEKTGHPYEPALSLQWFG